MEKWPVRICFFTWEIEKQYSCATPSFILYACFCTYTKSFFFSEQNYLPVKQCSAQYNAASCLRQAMKLLTRIFRVWWSPHSQTKRFDNWLHLAFNNGSDMILSRHRVVLNSSINKEKKSIRKPRMKRYKQILSINTACIKRAWVFGDKTSWWCGEGEDDGMQSSSTVVVLRGV